MYRWYIIQILKTKRLRHLLLFGVIVLISISAILSSIGSNSTVGRNSEDLILSQYSTSEVVQPASITVIQGPSTKFSCENSGSSHYMLFMYITSPENVKQRNAIRTIWSKRLESWEQIVIGKFQHYKIGSAIRALFFVGRPSEDSSITLPDLINEGENNGDMIIDNFIESYFNLTIKTLRMLKWVEFNCAEVPFMVKIDDDVHLNIPRILNYLHSVTSTTGGQDLIMGHKYSNVEVIRDPSSKWYTSISTWEPKYFPDFVSGICYILGSAVRAQLYHVALTTRLFHLEDVFLTGMVREKIGPTTSGLVDIPGVKVWWVTWQKLFYTCSVLQTLTIIHPLSTKEFLCYNQIGEVCDTILPLYFYC